MTDTFNLLDEPWIRALDSSGTEVSLSLTEVFGEAHRLTRLLGDVPTQEAAILRLLLAVLYRATPVDERDPVEVWREMWERGCFDERPAAYLQQWRHRFDLLDPVAPFMQVSGLHTAKGEFKSLAQMVADIPPEKSHQFFTTRSLASLTRMQLPDAARWIVHTQAFDPSGIKSGAVGDNRVKGGKGYPIGVGWVGNLGVLLIEGRSLYETLLLNLVLDADNLEDSAVWEREPLGPGEERRSKPGPAGTADLLTWPSRRLRLVVVDGAASEVLICNGDPLHPRNQHRFEMMTSWRRSEPQEKATGLARVLMPRTHTPGRAIWRSLGATLALDSQGVPGAGQRAGTLRWLGDLKRSRCLADDERVGLHAVGIAYGSNNSVIDDIYDDRLSAAFGVLADSGLQCLAIAAVEDADHACRALGDLARNLELAAGGSGDAAAEDARATGYATLDDPYRRWLASLAPGQPVDPVRSQWQRFVRGAVTEIGRDLVGRSGMPAWLGREINTRTYSGFMNSAIAEIRFASALRRALPTDPSEREHE